jgi:hypothetical protein
MPKISLSCCIAALSLAVIPGISEAEIHACPFGPVTSTDILLPPDPFTGISLCDETANNQAAPEEPPPRPLTAEEARMAGEVLLKMQIQQSLREIYGDGQWVLDYPSCDVSFGSKDGIIDIGVFRGRPYVNFASVDIPTVEAVATVEITLEQAGQAPLTLGALHGSKLAGMGVFQVFETALVEDGFVNLPDAVDFVIRLDGGPPARLGWRDAAAARAKLRQCYAP